MFDVVRRRGLTLSATVLAGILGPAGAASAGELRYEPDPPDAPSHVDLTYSSYSEFVGDPGDRDRVTMTLSGGEATVVAQGAILRPELLDPAPALTNCSFVIDRATCRDRSGLPILDAALELGEGDDSGTLVGELGGRIRGGWGSDVLNGSAGDDHLQGDLDTGPGAIGADVLSGGGGEDTADYRDHPGPVTVSLDDLPNDGTAGEGDNVHSDVEEVWGTLGGGDTLIGNDGANHLWGSGDLRGLGGPDTLLSDNRAGVSAYDGGAGADRVIGGMRADTIVGGAGEDEIQGREHDDVVEAADGERDLVLCGPGDDAVTADALDELRDCERVETT